MTVKERLQSLGITLPSPAAPLASYVPAVRAGEFVFTSGQLPMRDGQLQCQGCVGDDVSEEEAAAAARIAAINCLAAVQSVVGDLEKVQRVVRVTGYVRSAANFSRQPTVVNGASDLLLQVFGDRGQHSRTAVGVAQLPLGAAVEVDLMVQV